MQAFVYDHDRQEIGVRDAGGINILQPAEARVLIQELHDALAVVETHTHTQHVVFSPALGLLPCVILAHNEQIALVRAVLDGRVGEPVRVTKSDVFAVQDIHPTLLLRYHITPPATAGNPPEEARDGYEYPGV